MVRLLTPAKQMFLAWKNSVKEVRICYLRDTLAESQQSTGILGWLTNLYTEASHANNEDIGSSHALWTGSQWIS